MNILIDHRPSRRTGLFCPSVSSALSAVLPHVKNPRKISPKACHYLASGSSHRCALYLQSRKNLPCPRCRSVAALDACRSRAAPSKMLCFPTQPIAITNSNLFPLRNTAQKQAVQLPLENALGIDALGHSLVTCFVIGHSCCTSKSSSFRGTRFGFPRPISARRLRLLRSLQFGLIPASGPRRCPGGHSPCSEEDLQLRPDFRPVSNASR